MLSKAADITPDRIAAAAELIRPHVRHTPVMRVSLADFGVEGGDLRPQARMPAAFRIVQGARRLHQSFDPRGAGGRRGGIGRQSWGGGSYAAMRLGRKASIYVPSIKHQGQDRPHPEFRCRPGDRRRALCRCAGREAEALTQTSGAMRIHAFNQPETLMRQGTLGREIEEDLPGLDTLVVAVGGGGLIGGIAAWFGGRVKIVAVEPEEAPTLNMALAAAGRAGRCAGGRDRSANSLAPGRSAT